MEKNTQKPIVSLVEHTPYNVGKSKTVKRLHDTTKRKVQSDRPANVYKEYVVDDDSGEGGWWIHYNTELGNNVGLVSLDKLNEHTMERTEEGKEWTIPYTKANRDKIFNMRFGQTKFYRKDGNTRIFLKNPETEF